MFRSLLRPGRIDEPLLGDVGGVFDQHSNLAQLSLGEPSQNVLGGVLIARRTPYTDLQPPKLGGPEVFLNGSDSVVSTGATAVLEAKTAEGEIDVVMNHEEAPSFDFEVREERSHRSPNLVHEGVVGGQ